MKAETELSVSPEIIAAVEKDLQAARGSKGGKKTLKRHGKTHFSKMSQKRWGKRKAK